MNTVNTRLEDQDLVLDRSRDVLSPHHLIQILGLVLTLPVVQGVQGTTSSGVKQLGHEGE